MPISLWPDRWRRQWGTQFTLRGPDGNIINRYVSPCRWWTYQGALEAASNEYTLYDGVLRQHVTIAPIKAGPFDEVDYLTAAEERHQGSAGRGDR